MPRPAAPHVDEDPVALGVTAQQVDPMGGRPTAVSCPTATFCVVADRFGRVVYDRSGTWSAPVPIEPTPQNFDQVANISTVSCGSDTFCAAFDSNGDGYLYNGSTWTRVPNVGIESSAITSGSLSCLPDFCIGVVGQDFTRYDENGWSTPADVGVSGAGFLTSVSCVTRTFCAAVDTAGNAAVYDGTSWTVTSAVMPATYSSASVSCSSATFCETVQGTHAAAFDGTHWQTATVPSTDPAFLQSVSCPADGTCTAVDNAGAALDLVAGAWTRAAGVGANGDLLAVDCSSVETCLAVDRFGGATARTAAGWGTTAIVDQNTGGLNTISCTGFTFCAATDLSGNAVTYDGASWSAPTAVDVHASFHTLSCASPTLCVAAGTRPSADRRSYVGALAMFDGQQWTEQADAPALAAVSCARDGFCAGIGYDGTSVTYRDGVWSDPKASGAQDLGDALSCVSATFCATARETFDGQAWHVTPSSTGVFPGGQSISCATSTYCAAPTGMVMSFYNGTTWTQTHKAASWSSGDAIDCVTPSFCMTVSALGRYVVPFEQGQPQYVTRIDARDGILDELAAVSCTSTEQCLAVNSTQVITWHTHVQPVVTEQPRSASAPADGSVTLHALGTGNPAPLPVWQRRALPWQQWSDYSTGSRLDTNLAGDYRVAFENSAGTTYSTVVHVTIGAAPRVTAQPRSVTALKGRTATLTAGAQGDPTPGVQWQRSLDRGHTWAAMRGATARSLRVVATTTARYRAVFRNSVGSATSAVALLTVVTAPHVLRHPVTQTARVGATAIFTAHATGTPTPTVRWQASTNRGRTWTAVAGATTTTLRLPATAARNGHWYRAVFTNRYGTAVTHAAALHVHR